MNFNLVIGYVRHSEFADIHFCGPEWSTGHHGLDECFGVPQVPSAPPSWTPEWSASHFPWPTNRGTCLIATKVPSSDILPYLVPVKSWQRTAFRLHMESPPPISQSSHFLICDIWQWNESLECISGNHLLLANWIVPVLLIPPSEVCLAWMAVPPFLLALTCSCSY